MKKTFILFVSLLLLHCNSLTGKEAETKTYPSPERTINILSSPDLYNLSMNWANEYCRLHPNVNINVTNYKDAKTALTSGSNLCFVSREDFVATNNNMVWKMTIGCDALIPIINAKNPFLEEINKQGISPEKLARLFKNPESRLWSTLLAKGQKVPVNYYMINKESLKSTVANFVNVKPNEISGITVENGEQLISAIQKDPYAIGFCKMINVLNASTQSLAENIKLLPIDKNGNGQLDYNEKIYDDMLSFMRGVWIGKFPKALTSDIYSIASVKPKSEVEVAFLKWVLTDGQQFLNTNGYYDLVSIDRQDKFDMLSNTGIYAKPTVDAYPLRMIILIAVAMLAISVLVFGVILANTEKNNETNSTIHAITPSPFNENSIKAPNGIYYDKTHTWAFMERDGLVKIGIDDFLTQLTGPLTRVKMKNLGELVKKGEPIIAINHNGKQLNINAPISGTIMACNEMLDKQPSQINASPYNDGWVYAIEPSNWVREIQFLLIAAKYKEWIKNEFVRLKDFLTFVLKPNTPEFAHVTLQDGGELIDNTLADLDPAVWEEFQSTFIDTSK